MKKLLSPTNENCKSRLQQEKVHSSDGQILNPNLIVKSQIAGSQIKSLHLKSNRQNGSNRELNPNRDWDLPITASQCRWVDRHQSQHHGCRDTERIQQMTHNGIYYLANLELHKTVSNIDASLFLMLQKMSNKKFLPSQDDRRRTESRMYHFCSTLSQHSPLHMLSSVLENQPAHL